MTQTADDRVREIAREIYSTWRKDERWQRLDLATVSEGKPFAYFWAEIAARAIASAIRALARKDER